MGVSHTKASLVQQMKTQGTLSSGSFSLCYSRQDLPERQLPRGVDSGAMTLGGTDPRLHQTPMVYSKLTLGRRGKYNVQVRNIYLQQQSKQGDNNNIHGRNRTLKKKSGMQQQQEPQVLDDGTVVISVFGKSSLEYLSGSVIVDSGTTDTYFPSVIRDAYRNAFATLSDGQTPGHERHDLTLEQVQALPTILIQLEGDETRNQQVRQEYQKGGGNIDANNHTWVPGLAEHIDPDHPDDVLIAIPPTHYMEYNFEFQKWTNGFYTRPSSQGILGGNAMMGHDVHFNVEEQVLGWAQAECNYTRLLETNHYFDTVGGGSSSSSSSSSSTLWNGKNNNEDEPSIGTQTSSSRSQTHQSSLPAARSPTNPKDHAPPPPPKEATTTRNPPRPSPSGSTTANTTIRKPILFSSSSVITILRLLSYALIAGGVAMLLVYPRGGGGGVSWLSLRHRHHRRRLNHEEEGSSSDVHERVHFLSSSPEDDDANGQVELQDVS